MAIIKAALDGYARSPAMAKVFIMDRTRTIGASEIGQCARRMYWVKTEQLPDADHVDGWGARMRGSIMEEQFWVKAMTKRFGKNFIMGGKKQATLTDRFLSCTPDGMLINQPRDLLSSLGVPDIGPSQTIVVECKTIDPRVNLTEAKAENAHQTQVQLGLIREFTRYKPDYALISYMDASFWDDVDEFPIQFNEEIFRRSHDRAVKIKTASNAFELQPEGWIAGGKECEHCPFTGPCGIIRRSVPERELAADPQFVAEMTDLCAEHENLARLQKKVLYALNEKKDQIKNRLREKSVRKLPGVVSWSPVKGRTTYNQTAIKEAAIAAGVDVEQFATVGDPTDMLRVLIGGPIQSED